MSLVERAGVAGSKNGAPLRSQADLTDVTPHHLQKEYFFFLPTGQEFREEQ
jgi:hypothetical protein